MFAYVHRVGNWERKETVGGYSRFTEKNHSSWDFLVLDIARLRQKRLRASLGDDAGFDGQLVYREAKARKETVELLIYRDIYVSLPLSGRALPTLPFLDKGLWEWGNALIVQYIA